MKTITPVSVETGVIFIYFSLRVVLFVSCSVDDLYDLNYRDDENCKPESNAIFGEIELSEFECICEEGNLNNYRCKDK